MFFLKVLLIIFFLLCLWFAWQRTLLIIAYRNACHSFNKFFADFKKYTEVICMFLDEYQKITNADIEKVNKTFEFISKIRDFSVEVDGNERIIGYMNAILSNADDLLSVFELEENKSDIHEKYLISKKNFETEKEKYNNDAKILKHYVDVFPTSFIARLKDIRFVDYVK